MLVPLSRLAVDLLGCEHLTLTGEPPGELLEETGIQGRPRALGTVIVEEDGVCPDR